MQAVRTPACATASRRLAPSNTGPQAPAPASQSIKMPLTPPPRGGHGWPLSLLLPAFWGDRDSQTLGYSSQTQLRSTNRAALEELPPSKGSSPLYINQKPQVASNSPATAGTAWLWAVMSVPQSSSVVFKFQLRQMGGCQSRPTRISSTGNTSTQAVSPNRSPLP
jgi:hypothetical protein